MNFDESPSKLTPSEFMAVLIAGFGNELSPLTSKGSEGPSPKALLPVANKPMLDYPLAWLESSGIRDVLIICPTSHRSVISHYTQSDSSSSFPSLRIDLQTFDESQELGAGTCTILRHYASRIQQDFIVLPCDLIPPPSLALSHLLNKFRAESTSDGAIMTTCFFEPRRSDKASPFDEWSNASLNTPIVWDQLSDTLLHVDTNDDADHEPDNIVLNMNMMSRYPRAKLSAGFQDSHVYVCRRSILNILQEKPRFESIREEFLPWMCTPQYNLSRREKFGHLVDHRGSGMSQHSALAHSTLHTLKSGLNESSDDEHETADDPISGLRIGIVIHRAQEGITFRANTLPAYLDANHHFLSQTTYSLPSDPASRSLIDPKAQIASDSMVGHTTKVGERTSIKRSVVGKHCVIGKYVRISGCVILDHCIIADGAKIDGCILGASTKIGSKAELSRCVTQSGYEVTTGESYKNERLEVSDWTAASQSEAEESDTGSDSTDDDG